MMYTKRFFDPVEAGGQAIEGGSVVYRSGPKPENLYVYSPKTILALNVAMATGRPLLVAGEPGSGKSSLARNVSEIIGAVYYERVITSKTQAENLLWNFDALRRLSDASVRGSRVSPPAAYVEPGPIWWVFDPEGAGRERGGRVYADPGICGSGADRGRAVLLLDEIDKADPDVPNDMLEPFGAKSFTVRETGEPVVAKRDALLMLTTNGERELPSAFLRRCVVLTIEPPEQNWQSWFVQVAERKFGSASGTLYDDVAKQIVTLRQAAQAAGQRPPGTGEFLDALIACRSLGVSVLSEAFEAVTSAASWKQRDPPPNRVQEADQET